MADAKKFTDIYDYLSAPEEPTEPETALVFGRNDLRLVDTMQSLADRRLASAFVITGAYGKDSNSLWDLRIPESKYLASIASSPPHNIPIGTIHLDLKPLDGNDGARFGLKLMDKRKLPRDELTVVAHAISLRRLAATVEHQGNNVKPKTTKVHRVGTDYPFNPSNETDQQESAAELLRLAYWPSEGALPEQPDLPWEHVEFAESIVPKRPMPPSELGKAVLRHAPLRIRRYAIEKALSK